MKKEIIIATHNIDNIYKNRVGVCQDEINALIRERENGCKKKLLQKSVNVWNRSMVQDLIKHQFRE